MVTRTLMLERVRAYHPCAVLASHIPMKGVLKAVSNVNDTIAPALIQSGLKVTQQKEIDDFLIRLDGTPNRASSVPTLSSAYPLQLRMLPQPRRASRCTNTLRSWQASSLHTCFPPPRSMSSMAALTLGTSSLSKNSCFSTSARAASLKRSKLAETYHTLKKVISAKYGIDGQCSLYILHFHRIHGS